MQTNYLWPITNPSLLEDARALTVFKLYSFEHRTDEETPDSWMQVDLPKLNELMVGPGQEFCSTLSPLPQTCSSLAYATLSLESKLLPQLRSKQAISLVFSFLALSKRA